MPPTPMVVTSAEPSKVGAEEEDKLTFKLRALESLSAVVALTALASESNLELTLALVA